MTSLQGLPPLPKSLSGLLSYNSAQWKEMERIHQMRTMIQQDLIRSSQAMHSSVAGGGGTESGERSSSSGEASTGRGVSMGSPHSRIRKTSTLDVQLAVLRKEMVGLRQLDMSLLCQLWSLNESLLDYKHLLQERLSRSLSHADVTSPGWDNGADDQSSCDEPDSPGPFSKAQTQHSFERRRQPHQQQQQQRNLQMVREDLSLSSSTSHSSLEFGDI